MSTSNQVREHVPFLPEPSRQLRDESALLLEGVAHRLSVPVFDRHANAYIRCSCGHVSEAFLSETRSGAQQWYPAICPVLSAIETYHDRIAGARAELAADIKRLAAFSGMNQRELGERQ